MAEELIAEIKERCCDEDNRIIDILLKGFDSESLDRDFYKSALKEKNAFIKEYFCFDLNLRNAKARYLNAKLSRNAEADTIQLDEDGDEDADFPEASSLDDILNKSDILERERGLDDLYWKKIDELITFKYFDMDVILAFVAKLHIIDRWLKLDEQTGREMFRNLVNDIRSTYEGVQNFE